MTYRITIECEDCGRTLPVPFRGCGAENEVKFVLVEEREVPLGWTHLDKMHRCPRCSRENAGQTKAQEAARPKEDWFVPQLGGSKRAIQTLRELLRTHLSHVEPGEDTEMILLHYPLTTTSVPAIADHLKKHHGAFLEEMKCRSQIQVNEKALAFFMSIRSPALLALHRELRPGDAKGHQATSLADVVTAKDPMVMDWFLRWTLGESSVGVDHLLYALRDLATLDRTTWKGAATVRTLLTEAFGYDPWNPPLKITERGAHVIRLLQRHFPDVVQWMIALRPVLQEAPSNLENTPS